ncbi:MAG: substrate-binding domain-containing protein [Propionicimonas sp.]|uniref:LacI family DNA-binding transcriptional regulator n=1 Tax=Propionicimonas sp. TaxID=1955623 RepID=UPI003D0F2B01
MVLPAESPVTMKTLAHQIGVSVATVSNAYSRPDQLSAELRHQILATAEELGYAGPSVAGRALRSGRNDVCGFLFGGELATAFSDPYSVIFLAGLSESVEQFGASVLLLKAPVGDGATQALQRAPIDALVANSTVASQTGIEMLRGRGVRIVRTRRCEDGDWVGINDASAAQLVARHLFRLGHRDIVVVAAGASTGGVDEWAYHPDRPVPGLVEGSYESERIRGIWDELTPRALRVVRAGANTRAAGRTAAGQALDVQARPTAIVALSDVLAFGILDAVRARGLEPGRDISICGFDDIPDANFLGLTTLHQPITKKGRLAGLLAMDPDHPQRHNPLPVQLVVRASTGPAPTPRK